VVKADHQTGALSAAMRAWVAQNRGAAVVAMRQAAERAKSLYVSRTSELRVVDTGRLKSSFLVEKLPDGAMLANAAPYFVVMDEGRRAGAKAPPLEPILQWVLRKRLTGYARAKTKKQPDLMKQARSIAFLIRRSIARKGIKPRGIVTGTGVQATVWSFVEQAMREAAS